MQLRHHTVGMKRLLLPPILLLSASAASSQSVFLKCTYDYPHKDGHTVTGIHEFSINAAVDSISWTDGGNTMKPITKGALVVSGDSYYGVFEDNIKTTKVQISRVNGIFKMERIYGPVNSIEERGLCSKAVAQR